MASSAAIDSGQVSLDFLDAPAFERFGTFSGATFAELAEQTGVPVELLLSIREATGAVAPGPDDRVRDAELPYVAMIEGQLDGGFRSAAIQQLIRAQGDSMRRIAETESATWISEVIEPATRAGVRPDEILGVDFGDRMSVLTEQAVIAMYHIQQTRAWTAGIIDGLEMQLAAAGLHSRLEHPPAMCFLDITGYTRLTQEHGDAAAARAGRAARPDRPADGGQARRPAREVARGRRDAALPEPGARRGRGARDGRRPGRGGAAARARRPACRAGDLPGGRLLRRRRSTSPRGSPTTPRPAR